MNAGRAFVAGIVAAAVTIVVMFLLEMTGVQLEIPKRLAEVFGASGWVVGLVFYLVIGGVVALVYAAVFEWILNQAGVGAGLLIGACNSIVAGFLWAPTMNPGRFWQFFGVAGMATLFLVHFVYGGLVGGLYRTKHQLT